MLFFAPIALLAFLVAFWLIPRALVNQAEDECISLLTVWMEENGMCLLRHRLIWVALDFDSPPRAIYFVDIEVENGRKRAGWATIVGRTLALREFVPVSVAVHWFRQPQFHLSTLMALVLYVAIDLALLRVALTQGSILCLGVFGVLTFFVPPTAYIRWRIAESCHT